MKNLKAVSLTLAAGVLAFGAASAAAQSKTTTATTTTATTTTTADKTPGGDAHFIKKVAGASMGEVEMARMGTDKAASSEVKQFAQKMVDDHTKANGELTTLASSKSVDIAMDSKKHDKMNDKFSDKAGVDFDKAFMKQMVADHKKVVREFEHEAKSGKDPEVKAWAEKTLPTLREHLQEAQTIYDGLKGSAKNEVSRSTTKTSS